MRSPVWGIVGWRRPLAGREKVSELVSLYVRTIFWISETIEVAVSEFTSAEGPYTDTEENQTISSQQVVDVERWD